MMLIGSQVKNYTVALIDRREIKTKDLIFGEHGILFSYPMKENPAADAGIEFVPYGQVEYVLEGERS